MAAQPKKKTSRVRTKTRQAQFRLRHLSLVKCPQCGSYKLPHLACPTCGYYAGVKVIETKADKEIEAKLKAKEKERRAKEKKKKKGETKATKKTKAEKKEKS